MPKIKRIIQFIKYIGNRMKESYASAYAASVTLFLVMSVFPFIMFLLTILQYTPIKQSTLTIFITQMVPTNIASILISWINEIYGKAFSGTILSITAITMLWSSSKGFLALLKGLNSVYDIKETRTYIHVRLVSVFYTFMFAVMLTATLAVLVFGNRLYSYLYDTYEWLDSFLLFLISFRILFSFILLFIFFSIIMLFVPNRKSRLSSEFPGAFVATCGWIGFSYLFSYYYDHFNSMSIYGSLTSIVLLMLWLYTCMNILFLGSVLNSFLTNRRIKTVRPSR